MAGDERMIPDVGRDHWIAPSTLSQFGNGRLTADIKMPVTQGRGGKTHTADRRLPFDRTGGRVKGVDVSVIGPDEQNSLMTCR